jgi:hypothetical protein
VLSIKSVIVSVVELVQDNGTPLDRTSHWSISNWPFSSWLSWHCSLLLLLSPVRLNLLSFCLLLLLFVPLSAVFLVVAVDLILQPHMEGSPDALFV